MSTAQKAPVNRTSALDVLVQRGKITAEQATTIAQTALAKQRSPVAELVTSQTITARELAKTLSSALACPLLDLNAIAINQLPRDPTRFSSSICN